MGLMNLRSCKLGKTIADFLTFLALFQMKVGTRVEDENFDSLFHIELKGESIILS